jgi:ubiquinone/menaquinone biosynthesis C-methylase UbiE
MDHTEMVDLIRGGVGAPGGTWADLGAGTGNFTRALRELLGPQGTIYAVDRDAKAITSQRAALASTPGAAIHLIQADFIQPIKLPLLDGALMANALHFVRDQPAALARIAGYLRPGGRLLLVEYDLALPMPWVPFPVPLDRFSTLARQIGLAEPTLVGTRRSPSTGTAMYAAVAASPKRPYDLPPATV